MPLLNNEQIEAILSRGFEALAKKRVSALRRPLRLRDYERPGWSQLDRFLRDDPAWRNLTDRQRDMIGLRFWQRQQEQNRQHRQERNRETADPTVRRT